MIFNPPNPPFCTSQIYLGPIGLNVQPQGGNIQPVLINVAPTGKNVQPQGKVIQPVHKIIAPTHISYNPQGHLDGSVKVDLTAAPPATGP